MLKTILQLTRFPGIFTAFSNVLVGFFIISYGQFEINILPFLLTTTGLLFSAGMILNDYFDYKVDLMERPERPIPSKKIPRKTALFLVIIFFIAANLSAAVIGIESITVSLIMTILIIIYNFKAKKIPVIGIINLSSIRFLNIVLGFSITTLNFEIIHYAIPLALFVAGISILAKNEIKPTVQNKIFNIIFILISIIFTVTLIIQNYNIFSILFLFIFSAVILIPIFRNKFHNIPKIITMQLLAITLLDATIVSLGAEIIFVIITASLFIPGYIISKRLYVT